MSIILFLMAYFTVGVSLVQGALYISRYDLEREGFYHYRMIVFISSIWPMFLGLMIGYWCWAGYHRTKHWVRAL